MPISRNLPDFRSRSNGHIDEGELESTETGRVFPIVRGIPRFVENGAYTDSFGLQWNRFRNVQLDSVTGASHSRRRFDAETGWSEDEIRGKWVLDGGSGAGRFAEIAAARGANLVALDLSSAVEAAHETLAKFPNAHVVQGSLLDPPFAKVAFDYAYSIGVVQHTPDRAKAIASLVACVKPGGKFCLTIYARRPWTKLNTKYLVRPLTSRMKQERLLGLIERVMPVAFPAADALFRLPMIGKLARFSIPVAVYVDKGNEFSREQRYQEAVLDTFDMLSPKYDAPVTAQEVDTVLRNAGVHGWDYKTRVPVVVVGVR